MNQAKLQVGQAVAVCTSALHLVIPKAVVTEMRYDIRSPATEPLLGKRGWAAEGWYYCVSPSPVGDDGKPVLILERCLRAIDDDEYKDTLQDEQPINTWRGRQHKSPEEIQRMMDNART